jgi:hypothetical protein
MEKTKQTLTILKQNMKMTQNMIKKQVYQHRSERQFEDRDWVFLRLQPYNKSTLITTNDRYFVLTLTWFH